MNNNTDIQAIVQKLNVFSSKRDWQQFHNPKNLAMALSVESSELLEIFQWLTPEESINLSDKQISHLKEEIADVFLYLLKICDGFNIDLIQAAHDKIKINKKKYPADAVKGKADKCTTYAP